MNGSLAKAGNALVGVDLDEYLIGFDTYGLGFEVGDLDISRQFSGQVARQELLVEGYADEGDTELFDELSSMHNGVGQQCCKRGRTERWVGRRYLEGDQF